MFGKCFNPKHILVLLHYHEIITNDETDVFYLDEDMWSIKFKPIAEGLVAQLRSHDVSK